MRILIILLIAALGICSGCDSRKPQADSNEGGNEPKTYYGQSVKKAKDVSKALGERDEAIAEQNELLSDE